MKTVRDQLVNLFVTNGMFESQANAVIDIFIKLPENIALQSRFEDIEGEYPKKMIYVWFELMRPTALQYIEENCPRAWFKPVFMDEKTRQEYLASPVN